MATASGGSAAVGGSLDWSEEVANAGRRSWAAVLGRSAPYIQCKNVLEIVLQKEGRGSFIVSESECARLLGKLGLDLRPNVHVEGVQICPSGRGVILVTLKDNIDINNFCRYDVIDVNTSGVRAVMVKPAGKRDVIISIRGIHPNTSDEVVLDYLEKFGKVVTRRVIHGVYSDAPLKGMKNGNRTFKLELTPGTNIGSYHFLDGQKVTLIYPGQQQTCARCLQTSSECKGKGVARKCESEGGLKSDFISYIINLWHRIGYTPPDGEVSAPYDDEESQDKSRLEEHSLLPRLFLHLKNSQEYH